MKKILVAGLLFAPFLASAQLTNVSSLLTSFKGLVAAAIPIVMGIALLGFFWGLAMFIFQANEPERRAEGRSIMIWGIVALFIMSAVWGLVAWLGTAVGVTPNSGTGSAPTISNL